MRVSGRARKILLTIGIVVGVVLVLFVSLPLAVQIPSIQAQIRSRIQSELHTQLDREIEIGDVGLGLFLRSLEVRNIRIASGERLEDGVLAEIEAVEVYPSLADLLRLRIGLNRIVVRRPTVTLPQAEAKPTAPPTDRPSPAAPSMPVAVPLGIQDVEILDGSIRVSDTQVTVARLHANLQAPAGAIGGTLTIRQTMIQTGATPFLVHELVLKAGIEGEDIKVTEVHLSAQGADVEAQGRVFRFLSDSTIDLTLKTRSDLAKVFPEGPPVPLRGDFSLEGKIAGPLADPSFTGRATVGRGQIKDVALSGMTVGVEANRRDLHLKQLTLKTSSGDLAGDVTLAWDKLRYDVALRGERVDLTDVLRIATGDAPVGGQATIHVQATGEGTDLTKAKGQANLRVEGFHLGDDKDRGHVTFVLDGRDGRVHVRQGEVELASTSLRTTGVVKLGGDLDLDVDMRFSKLVDFGRLLGADPGDVDGQATIKGRLTGPIADPTLRGTLEWTNATLLEVTFDSLRAPVEIAFARQTLDSPSMTVLRQELRADLKVRLILAPKPPDRKILLKYDLTLDIDGGIEGPLEELLGIFVQGSVPLAGPIHLKTEIRGTPDTLRGEGALTMTDAVIVDEPWQQVHATVKLELQKKKVWIEGLELQRDSEKVAGHFDIGFDGSSQFALSSNRLAIQRLAPLHDSGLTGTVTVVSAEGQGPIGHPRVDITFEVADLAHHDVNVGDGQGSLTWDLSQDRLTGQLSIPERGYSLRPNITTKAPHPYEATLTLEKGELGTLLRLVQGNVPAHVGGVASGRIDVAGRLGEVPERATVNFDAARLDIQEQTFQTEDPFRLTFEKGELTIVPVTLSGEASRITVGGTIGKQMDLKIAGAAPAALVTLVSPEVRDAKGVVDLDVTVQGPQLAPRYLGHIQTKDTSVALHAHPEPIKDLQGEIRLTANAVETDGLKAQWAGGKIDAKLRGKLEDQGWGWRFQVILEEARVERIFVNPEGEKKDPMATGPLRVSGDITAGGAADLLATIGGQVRFEAVDGVIQRTFSLEKALKLVNLSFLFERGPGGKGLPYTELSGTFNLENGIAKTKDWKLDSPVLQVVAVGQLDLPQQNVNALMVVQPLQLSDKVLRAVGDAPIIKQAGIGTLLFGRNRSFMVVTYRVHGSLSDPEVEKVPTKAVDKGVLGIFGRTLNLPADALQDLGAASPEKKPTSPEPSQ